MNLSAKQIETRDKIRKIALAIGVDPGWACAIALEESSLGVNLISPTGARGVGNMTTIAMKDCLQEMGFGNNTVGAACMCAYLQILFGRFKNIEMATGHYCAEKDRHFYVKKVLDYREELKDV